VATDDFFEEGRDASRVKAEIVVKYLVAWGRVMASQTRGHLLYFDPFAGPGAYADGSRSTPLLCLDAAIANMQLAQQLVMVLGDRDQGYCEELRGHIDETAGIETLANAPIVVCDDVDHDLAAMLARTDLAPTFAFLDPWGYKGLSLDLVNSLLKDWGCDCLFFFNYNRVNAGLTNPKVDEHVTALFGAERAQCLRDEIQGLTPDAREAVVMGALLAALKEGAGDFVHLFRFMTPDGKRTSRYLVFASKHFLGYEIFRDITAKASSYAEGDVPAYTYTALPYQAGLFDHLIMEDFKDELARHFAGRTLTAKAVYEEHSPGKRFRAPNYKTALRELEQEGRIAADPPAEQRKKNTMADGTRVTVPSRPKEAGHG